MLSENHLPKKEICDYYAPWPVYALDWSRQPREQAFRLTVCSFMEQYSNKIQVVQYREGGAAADPLGGGHPSAAYPDDANVGGPPPPSPDFVVVAEADHPYPVTKTQWAPAARGGSAPDLLATSGDYLRLWEALPPQPGRPVSANLRLKATLNNAKGGFCAPLTSFDWNELDAARLVTCSIDTTCTVWDVTTQQAKTQLIAHDREVYDVAFSTGSADVFASAGADGSIRMFDLRDLEHSTIIYEAPPAPPLPAAAGAGRPGPPPSLMRLAFNRKDPNYLATFGMDAAAVQVLDVRMPGVPIAELRNHRASVNGIAWAPHSAQQVCTVGDDQQVLVWDLGPAGLGSGGARAGDGATYPPQGPGRPRSVLTLPSLTYTAAAEVNTVAWSRVVTDWVAIGFGHTVQTLRV
ncbi:hypothetical protein IWQ60_011306 [Tieghemiomyces parasiticus]|uniref:Uncharacterized protein n=1 Tax=Tieghemiomyces parasiticus TaxID=78921 RepID=A0A9W7ZP89_9FUNG|nr:hypothetical protein IWQ60_011306 [Tieghemiomyces parasiticus]